jgi:hypothetical protein
MRNKILIITALLLAYTASLSATNQAFYWWNESTDSAFKYSVRVPTTGTFKAIVFVVAFPEDSICQPAYANLDTIYPTFYDSLIAPSIEAAFTDSNYKWSITNFLYTASLGKDTIIGEVNPGYNHRYVIAPKNLSYYQIFGGAEAYLEKDIIQLADSVIDYSEFDVWGDDNYVDFVFFSGLV